MEKTYPTCNLRSNNKSTLNSYHSKVDNTCLSICYVHERKTGMLVSRAFKWPVAIKKDIFTKRDNTQCFQKYVDQNHWNCFRNGSTFLNGDC